MITDFISHRLWLASRLTQISGVRKALIMLYLILFMAVSVNAQVGINASPSANYKRPYDIEKNSNISGNEGQVIIAKSLRDKHSGEGSIWRYHTNPARIIITIDSKSKNEKKMQTIRSNYKAQH